MNSRKTITEQQVKIKEQAVTLREVLVNAIRMQATYSNGRIKYTESSIVSN